MTFDQWVLIFYAYCFIGWIWETFYVSIRAGKFCNRGFLHGPFLPIYGSGAIVILLSTFAIRENLMLVYIIGMISSTILEYFTGDAMQRIFGVRYWDYSKHRFNLKGHICLGVSLGWGLFSVLLVRFINPPVMDLVTAIPYRFTEILTHGLTIVLAVDTTVSVYEALDLKRILREMEEKVSDVRERVEYVLEEFSRREALENARFVKILKRNPGAVSLRLKEELEELKAQLEEYRKSSK